MPGTGKKRGPRRTTIHRPRGPKPSRPDLLGQSRWGFATHTTVDVTDFRARIRHEEKPGMGDQPSLSSDHRVPHSNCPILGDRVSRVIKQLPNEDRATARSVFVGRGLEPECQAEVGALDSAHPHIVVQLRYSFLLEAYSNAYVVWTRVFDAVRARHDGTTHAKVAKVDAFEIYWDDLDKEVERWLSFEEPVLVPSSFAPMLDSDQRNLALTLFDRAESFVVAHELAHIIIAKRPNSGLVRDARALLTQAAPGELQDLNGPQQEELLCDLIALRTCLGAYTQRPGLVPDFLALVGATIAIVTFAHYGDSWVEATADEFGPPIDPTHPGSLRRIRHLMTAAAKLKQGWPAWNNTDFVDPNLMFGFCMAFGVSGAAHAAKNPSELQHVLQEQLLLIVLDTSGAVRHDEAPFFDIEWLEQRLGLVSEGT